MSALEKQVGGDHYLGMEIKPMDLALANNLSAAQYNICKYVMRYPLKGGKKDLEKARHVIDWLIEHEYGKTEPLKPSFHSFTMGA